MTKLLGAAAILLGLSLPAAAQNADQVVATVNGTEITLGHMIAMRERLPQQYQTLDDAALYEGILEQLVQQTALGRDRTASPRTELIMENERRALIASERLDRIGENAVTAQAIQRRYDDLYAGAEGATMEYNANHILVETEGEAQALIDQLGGGADFAALARTESIGPSGPSGGELGWFGATDMVPAFGQAVQEMEVGEIAGPVQTQFGWHVIRLNDAREAGVPPLDEVRDEIADDLRAEAIQDAIDGIMDQSRITRSERQPPAAAIRNDSLLAE